MKFDYTPKIQKIEDILNNFVPELQSNENDISWSRTIEISEAYLKEDVAERFNKEFGLSLIGYDFVFYINPSVVSKYNPKESSYVLPKLNKENNSFLFHTNRHTLYPFHHTNL